MIDPFLGAGILVASIIVAAGFHSLIGYAGRAAFIGWLFLEVALWSWYLAFDPGVIYRYTVLATAVPAALLILLVGLPFERARRIRIRAIGEEVLREGGFACPHCGCLYDREREDDRCPDCGGAVDGGPGILG